MDELKKIMLSKISQTLKAKGLFCFVFFLICGSQRKKGNKGGRGEIHENLRETNRGKEPGEGEGKIMGNNTT